MDSYKPTPSAIAITALAVEYVRLVDNAAEYTPRDFLREIIRYMPRFYITLCDLKPYGDLEPDAEGENTDAILDQLSEEARQSVKNTLETVLGENDTYLDTHVEDMQYSDTPVAVSLAEQLTEVYEVMADLAVTVEDAPTESLPEIMSDLLFYFNDYLNETICSALKAANYAYHHADFEEY
ncbi:MAG: DUF5063 domain-containing protein [Bacteroidales bacterium]|nr:DUF5063 domain-containing protein [Bacteroidales bacterium]